VYHLHETGVISTIRVRDSSVEAKLVGNSDDAIVLRAPGVLCLAGVGLVNVLTDVWMASWMLNAFSKAMRTLLQDGENICNHCLGLSAAEVEEGYSDVTSDPADG